MICDNCHDGTFPVGSFYVLEGEGSKKCVQCGTVTTRKFDFSKKVPPAGSPYTLTPAPIISGVGKDAETVVNEQGGKQSKVQYRFDVLDPKAMFAMCKVLKEGYDKYGDDSNWRKIPVNEHLNHLLIHVYAYLAGDETDEHLSHALCRAMFALAVDLQ